MLTKGLAVEGTALIASERAEIVAARHGAAFVTRCQAFLHTPGISIVREAAIARAGGAIALHDPTEGGLATGLRELAGAAGLGLLVHADAIPIYPETARLCDDFGLDPLGLIASGALLAAAPPAAAGTIVDPSCRRWEFLPPLLGTSRPYRRSPPTARDHNDSTP